MTDTVERETRIKVTEVRAWSLKDSEVIIEDFQIELPNGMSVYISFDDYQNETRFPCNNELSIRVHGNGIKGKTTDVELTAFTDSKVIKKKTVSNESTWTDMRTTMEGR
jgi:hypothetical protein